MSKKVGLVQKVKKEKVKRIEISKKMVTWDDKDDDSCDAADDDNAVVLSCLSQMVEKGGLGQKVSPVKRQLVFRVNTSTIHISTHWSE